MADVPVSSSSSDEIAVGAAPSSAGDLSPGTEIGEYVVEGKIGEGGMGSVYEVRHPVIGKRAAIKVMSQHLSADASAVDRFVLEARSVNQIRHPNIVDVFAFGKLPDGRSYFVMEWLEGQSLYQLMRSRTLSTQESLVILLQICDALEAAHEHDIVHRDLKPDNVFLVPVRRNRVHVKLLDFGVAKLVTNGLPEARRTRSGTFVGTPYYISPEQARAKAVDYRTDIYALGVTAFEMFTHRLPFEADNAMDVVSMHLQTPAPRLSLYWNNPPPELELLLSRMLAKDPLARPSLTEVVETLELLRDTPSTVGPDGRISAEWTRAPSSDAAIRLPSTPAATAPLGALLPRPPTAGWTAFQAMAPAELAPSDEAPLPALVPSESEPIVLPPGLVAAEAAFDAAAASRPNHPRPAELDRRPVERQPAASAPAAAKPAAPRSVERDSVEPRAAVPAAPISVSMSVALPRSRRPRLIVLGSAAVMLLGLGALVLVPRTPPPAAPPPASQVAAAPLPPPPQAPVPAATAGLPMPQLGPGRLDVRISVPGASVTIDGRAVPVRKGQALATFAAAGSHAVVVSAPHRRPFRSTVLVEVGHTVELPVLLERAAAPAAPAPPASRDYTLDPFGKR